MPAHDDVKFENLLQCSYSALTVYKSSGEHICHGEKAAYEKLIQTFVDSPSSFKTKSQTSLLYEIIPSVFKVEDVLQGVAIYSEVEVAEHFPTLKKSPLLPSLINTHLHEHFLKLHPILAVIDPTDSSDFFGNNPTALAARVAQCPTSPFPGSCPPGMSPCKSCKSASLVRYHSLSRLPKYSFFFAAVPHPYTVLSLSHSKRNLDSHLIRETRRDDWVVRLTDHVVESHSGSYQRTQFIKDVAGRGPASVKAGLPDGVWQIWEEPDVSYLPWALGFEIEDIGLLVNDLRKGDGDNEFISETRKRVLSSTPERTRDAVELWNLAWAELWYFVRAIKNGYIQGD